MKKKYEKPEFFFESFEMSQCIAAGCELISNAVKDECAVTVPDPGWDDIHIFTNAVGACTSKYEDEEGGYKGICYFVPEETYNVFSS